MILTARQAIVVEFVGQHRARNACAPGAKEIGAVIGVPVSHARRIVEQCVRRGALTWERNSIRTLRVVEQGGEHMLWGCMNCVVDRVGVAVRVIKTEELHTLTVTVEGAPQPKCRVCEAPMTSLQWTKREAPIERTTEPA